MRKVILHAVLILGVAVVATPFFWMISTSLKTFVESIQVPPTLWPETPNWENYAEVFRNMNFGVYYKNTIIVTVAKTLGQLVLCSMAAYAFARLNFPLKNFLFLLVLSVLMVPSQVVLIPKFALMRVFGWINTYWAIIVPGVFSAFGTFLLRQFFLTIPRELEEAAKIDGCSIFRIFWNIFVPLSGPALVSLSIFTILASWNDFLWPLVVTTTDDMRLLSIGIASFQGEYRTNYPLLMAASVMATLPILLVFVVLQRYFIEGITLSGIKA
jgi:multiple sugar transport system permease protein